LRWAGVKAYLEIIRPTNCTMAGISSLAGLVIAATQYQEVSTLDAALVFGGVFLITGAGNTINDFFDLEIDQINRPERPLPQGKITPLSASAFALTLFTLGTALSLLLGPLPLVIALFNSVLLYLYAAHLKRKPLTGNLTVSYLTGSTFLYGGSVLGTNGIQKVLILTLLAMLATLSRELVKDIQDMPGDKQAGARTLPLQLGIKPTLQLTALTTLAAIALSPLPYLTLGTTYLYPALTADLILLTALREAPRNPARSSRLYKTGMITALLAFILPLAI